MLGLEETERVEDIFCQMDSDDDGLVTLQVHHWIFLQNDFFFTILLYFFQKKKVILDEDFL